jgi:hypothetical protein
MRGTLSPVRFGARLSGIAAISRDYVSALDYISARFPRTADINRDVVK